MNCVNCEAPLPEDSPDMCISCQDWFDHLLEMEALQDAYYYEDMAQAMEDEG